MLSPRVPSDLRGMQLRGSVIYEKSFEVPGLCGVGVTVKYRLGVKSAPHRYFLEAFRWVAHASVLQACWRLPNTTCASEVTSCNHSNDY